jgi:hypothetical protein
MSLDALRLVHNNLTQVIDYFKIKKATNNSTHELDALIQHDNDADHAEYDSSTSSSSATIKPMPVKYQPFDASTFGPDPNSNGGKKRFSPHKTLRRRRSRRNTLRRKKNKGRVHVRR